MRLRSIALAVTLVALTVTACSEKGPGEPVDNTGGVDLVVGEYCSSTAPVATKSGTTWNVTLATNTTTYRDVAGTDGIVRRQTVRGCQTQSCTFTSTPASWTATTAIAECRRVYG